MRKICVSVLALALALSPFAFSHGQEQAAGKQAPKAVVEDSEEGSLTVKIPSKPGGASDQPKIEADSSNVIVDPSAQPVQTLKGRFAPQYSPLPSGSLAAKIQPKGSVAWRPAWRFKGAGGPWLAGMELSGDGSVLAFVETTGKETGPFGSRVVLYSVNQWRTLKVFELDFKINSFAFVPDGSMILAASERQPELKQPFALHLVDLQLGAVSAGSQALPAAIRSIACASSAAAFVTVENGDSILSFDLDNLKAAPKRQKSRNASGVLALSKDGSLLAAAGKSGVDFFKVEGLDLQLDDSVDLPEGIGNVGKLIMLDGRKEYLLAPRASSNSSDATVLVRPSSQRKLVSYGSELAACSASSKEPMIFAVSKLNGGMTAFSLPSLDADLTASVEEMSPRSSGAPFQIAYIPSSDILLFLDSCGNFYSLKRSPKERKWYKTIIFAAMK